MNKNKTKPTEIEIQEWFEARLIELLDIEPDDIDISLAFDSYNLDSQMAVGLTSDLEEWLGYDIEPTLLYEYPSIEKISQYLAVENKESR